MVLISLYIFNLLLTIGKLTEWILLKQWFIPIRPIRIFSISRSTRSESQIGSHPHPEINTTRQTLNSLLPEPTHTHTRRSPLHPFNSTLDTLIIRLLDWWYLRQDVDHDDQFVEKWGWLSARGVYQFGGYRWGYFCYCILPGILIMSCFYELILRVDWNCDYFPFCFQLLRIRSRNPLLGWNRQKVRLSLHASSKLVALMWFHDY